MPKKVFSPAGAKYRCVPGKEARQIPENFEFSPALIKSNKKKTQQRVKLSIQQPQKHGENGKLERKEQERNLKFNKRNFKLSRITVVVVACSL